VVAPAHLCKLLCHVLCCAVLRAVLCCVLPPLLPPQLEEWAGIITTWARDAGVSDAVMLLEDLRSGPEVAGSGEERGGRGGGHGPGLHKDQ
jgi:hypothetical protein